MISWCFGSEDSLERKLASEMERVLTADPEEAAFSIQIPLYFLGRQLGHYGRARENPGHIRLFRQAAGQCKSGGLAPSLAGPMAP